MAKGSMRWLALLCMVAATPCRGDTLLLATGKTLTILDAADPKVRVVLKAPPHAPLDLGAILVAEPGDSVYSIVTRLQVDAAARMTQEADGSLELSAGAPAPAGNATLLQGGILVFNNGKFVYRPEPAPAGAQAAAPRPTPSGNGRLLISKRGVAKAQAERDIAQCRRHADAAAAQFLRASDRVATYNSAMYSCLKGLGYEIHTPAA